PPGPESRNTDETSRRRQGRPRQTPPSTRQGHPPPPKKEARPSCRTYNRRDSPARPKTMGERPVASRRDLSFPAPGRSSRLPAPGPVQQTGREDAPDSPGEAPPGDLLDGDWYTTEELAAILRIDPSSLRRWRTSDPAQGPPFFQLSDRVTLYSAHDVEDWLR